MDLQYFFTYEWFFGYWVEEVNKKLSWEWGKEVYVYKDRFKSIFLIFLTWLFRKLKFPILLVECATPMLLTNFAYAPTPVYLPFTTLLNWQWEAICGQHSWSVTQRFRCSWSWHVDTLLPLFASQRRPDKMCVYYRWLPPSSFGAWTSITLRFSLVNRRTAWVYSRTYSKEHITDLLLVLKINH
jgi:hypothetical protein